MEFMDNEDYCEKALPPSHEISPTKSSRRLMRQVSGLGMEDPVFGGRTISCNSSMEKLGMASFTSSSPQHIMMMDLFDDMGFEDLPKDMRDAVSVASDPTAAYCEDAFRNKLLLRDDTTGGCVRESYSDRSPDGEDTTTCTLTKDTLLAEAAQALEGRVSSDLLNVARHQLANSNKARKGVAAPWKPVVPQTSKHRIMPTIDNIFPSS